MIPRISRAAGAALAMAAAVLSDHCTAAQESPASSSCSCTPRSYTFRLALDGTDCSTSTLAPDDDDGSDGNNGIRNVDCQISDATGIRSRRRLDDDNDNEDDRYSSLQSHLRSALPPMASLLGDSRGSVRFDNFPRQTGPPSQPSYLSSVLFIEFDTSGTLSIINEDSTYLNDADLYDGATITYPSISSRLDPNLSIESQYERVPGGAGLFVFANDESGEVYLRSRVVWEFDGGCDVVTTMEGESLGWFVIEETTPPRREFCPVAPSSSPTIATPSPTTKMPTAIPTAEPTTAKPTPSPSASPTTSEPTMEPTTAQPTAGPSQRPTTGRPTTAEPTTSPTAGPTTGRPTDPPSKVPTESPSRRPTDSPSRTPTDSPTTSPSLEPVTNSPSVSPNLQPITDSPASASPTLDPVTESPTDPPAKTPTTTEPSSNPTKKPVVASTAPPSSSDETPIVTESPTVAEGIVPPATTPSPTTESPTVAEDIVAPATTPSPTAMEGNASAKPSVKPDEAGTGAPTKRTTTEPSSSSGGGDGTPTDGGKSKGSKLFKSSKSGKSKGSKMFRPEQQQPPEGKSGKSGSGGKSGKSGEDGFGHSSETAMGTNSKQGKDGAGGLSSKALGDKGGKGAKGGKIFKSGKVHHGSKASTVVAVHDKDARFRLFHPSR
mmetsp:Transcript_39446/g.94870  ORF Transcript_39446/g.94870 Transcript_39446/m.94870 type:complete len:662 (-) Transcript_39446:279-2264(-)